MDTKQKATKGNLEQTKPISERLEPKNLDNANKNPNAVALGRLGGLKGGKARLEKMTDEQRSNLARNAATARWTKLGKNSNTPINKVSTSEKQIYKSELVFNKPAMVAEVSTSQIYTISTPPEVVERIVRDTEPLGHELIKSNSIYHSNCVNLMESMDKNFIDLTVTSPPYDELRNYNGYHFDIESIAKGLLKVTKNGGVVVWVVGDKIKSGNRSLTSFKQALLFQSIGFNVHDIMIYKKKNTPFMRTNAYTNCYEFMLVLSKGSPKTFNPLKVKTARHGIEMLPFNKGADGINKKVLKELKTEKTKTNIWEYATGLGGTTNDKIAFKHPAVYPEKLAEDHILSWTNPGDIVFDPMCGSGTTCKMALVNNRLYIGCDISQEYVDLTKKRLGLVTPRCI